MARWIIIVIGASFFLLCFLLWYEFKRTNRQRLIWRIFASGLAVISLACTAFPVTISLTRSLPETGEAVLLTEGFNKDSIQSFVRKTSDQGRVYTTDGGIFKLAEPFKPTLITGTEALDPTSTLHVFGYGLDDDELKKLMGRPLVLHASKMPAGITAINWQRKLNAGDKLHIQGSFNNNLSNPVKLVLSGLNTHFDSIIVPSNTHKNFSLTTTPKHLDRAIYNLLAFDKKDTVEAEDIPVEVVQPKNVQILILAASPDFENKFLKNRLSEKGYALAVRSRISKNIYQKEYVNITGISLDNISSAALNKFDVLIADAAELAAISKPELQSIQSAVQKGLGLIVKADTSIIPGSFYTRNISLSKGRAINGKSTSLNFRSSGDTLTAFVVENPVYIRSGTGSQVLVQDANANIFANNTIYGRGKIVCTTLRNTYTLLLSGSHKSYDELWSALISKAAKKNIYPQIVAVSPALPRVNESLSILIQNTHNNLESAQAGYEKVYLQQNKLLPFLSTGTYWPGETGWLPLVDSEGKTNWFYVYRNNDWRTVYATNTLGATTRYAVKNIPEKSKNNAIEKDVPVSVPKIYFFFIFIISAGFLWFEKKLS